MTDNQTSAAGLTCANCGRLLDETDKFCRECGLPTLRRALEAKRVPAPPDTGEFKRALDEAALPAAETEGGVETTGDVLRATSPTMAVQMAAPTVIMLGIMAALAVGGVVLLILAFKP